MNPNTFVSKKLGEVHAFAIVGTDTLERAGAPLREVLGDEIVFDWIEKNTLYKNQIEITAKESGAGDTILKKSEATVEKLSAMRDMYIKDAWNNPTEVLEWLSFFFGAAYAHWGVVTGAAEAKNDAQFLGIAEDAMQAYYECLDTVAQELESIGQEKAEE